MEFETVKEAIQELVELSEAKSIINEQGSDLNGEETQELFKERVYALADILGFSEIYLNNQED